MLCRRALHAEGGSKSFTVKLIDPENHDDEDGPSVGTSGWWGRHDPEQPGADQRVPVRERIWRKSGRNGRQFWRRSTVFLYPPYGTYIDGSG